MAQVDKLLKYQETDEKLLKLEREMANSDERKNYVQAKNFLTKAPEKLDALEAKARELNAILNQLKEKYEEIAETLSDFDNLDELVGGGADISFYKKNVLQLVEKLKAIKAEAASFIKSVKDADEEYQAMKNKTIGNQNGGGPGRKKGTGSSCQRHRGRRFEKVRRKAQRAYFSHFVQGKRRPVFQMRQRAFACR